MPIRGWEVLNGRDRERERKRDREERSGRQADIFALINDS